MDSQKAKYFRQRLEEEKNRYRELLADMEKSGMNTSLADSISELSSYDNHPGDLGSEVFERSKDLALEDNARIQIQKIEDALKALADGTYGACDNCGQEISLERLEAVPETTLCLACRRELEESHEDKPTRPVEEGVIRPPFGGDLYQVAVRDVGTEGDEIGYDGEDAWQDVARYGTSETPSDLPGVENYPNVFWDADEDRGTVEAVESIPYFKGADGMFYEDLGQVINDEDAPAEKTVGDEGWDVAGKRPGEGKKERRAKH